MKLLIGAACVAIIAFVGYYFWNEYRSAQYIAAARSASAEQALRDYEADCDAWVKALNSWKNGRPDGHADSFAKARGEVDRCLNYTVGRPWHEKNIGVKYW